MHTDNAVCRVALLTSSQDNRTVLSYMAERPLASHDSILIAKLLKLRLFCYGRTDGQTDRQKERQTDRITTPIPH